MARQGFYLTAIDDHLQLCRSGESAERGLQVDLNSAAIRRRIAAGRRQPLARALGLHKRGGMTVLDTTCGLGRDAAVLAGLGCQLTAIERHPALHALLADALRRVDATGLAWRANWRALYHDDGISWLAHAGQNALFDVVYIDPMFDNTRRKARPHRALQWLAELVGADADGATLLAEARQHARRRVVVKSHARATPLAPPDHQIDGRGLRFDIYFSASKSFK